MVDDEELSEVDLDEKIRESVANNEYRMAIRFLYLKTLKVLNGKNAIKLHAKATITIIYSRCAVHPVQ